MTCSVTTIVRSWRDLTNKTSYWRPCQPVRTTVYGSASFAPSATRALAVRAAVSARPAAALSTRLAGPRSRHPWS
jgi:hypothetical protein